MDIGIHRELPNTEIRDRFGYTQDSQVDIEIGTLFVEAAKKLDALLPPGRAKSLAFTQLEEASMWAYKSVHTVTPNPTIRKNSSWK